MDIQSNCAYVNRTTWRKLLIQQSGTMMETIILCNNKHEVIRYESKQPHCNFTRNDYSSGKLTVCYGKGPFSSLIYL